MVSGSFEHVALRSIVNRLILDVRKVVLNYYNAQYVCSDSSCGWKTRDVSVRGSVCLQQGCQGKMDREVSPSQLFSQLHYYKNLFDFKKAKDLVTSENNKSKILRATFFLAIVHLANGIYIATLCTLVL
jgi:hypothetical protein